MLTDDQTMIRDAARTFAAERLKPFSPNGTGTRAFPARRWPRWGPSASWACSCREEYDGAAVDHVAYALAIEEIAAGDGAVSTIMSVHKLGRLHAVLKFGSEDQKQRFLRPLARGEHLGAFCLTEPGAAPTRRP